MKLNQMLLCVSNFSERTKLIVSMWSLVGLGNLGYGMNEHMLIMLPLYMHAQAGVRKVKHYAFIIIKSYDLVLRFCCPCCYHHHIIALWGKILLIFCIVLLFVGVMCVVWNFHIVEVPVTDIISFLIVPQDFSIHDIWHKIIYILPWQNACFFLTKSITVVALDLN